MFFKFIFKKKKKKLQETFKFDLNNWMDLTKEERHRIDSMEKEQKMIKKKRIVKID